MDSRFDLSRMGKPTGKAHVQSFDGMLQAECLALVHNSGKSERGYCAVPEGIEQRSFSQD